MLLSHPMRLGLYSLSLFRCKAIQSLHIRPETPDATSNPLVENPFKCFFGPSITSERGSFSMEITH